MSLLNEVAEGTDIVAFSLYLYLRKLYRVQFDDKKSGLLAVAVGNGVLSRLPGNEEGKLFQIENSRLINEKIMEIKNTPELCTLISETVMMQTLLDVKPLDTSDPEVILEHYEQVSEPIEKLKKYGLYVEKQIPTSFFKLRSRMKKFVKMAKNFHGEVS